MYKTNKWLITIDLDGTLLTSPKDSNKESHYNYNPYNLTVIKELVKIGHKVVIVTGRPWLNSKRVYESLGLKTMIGNYNGAHIHYPDNDSFIPLTFSMNKDILQEILVEPIIVNNNNGIVIESMDANYVLKGTNPKMLMNMNIVDEENIVDWEYGQDIKLNPQSVLISLNYENLDFYELLDTLKRKYGNAMFFRVWDNRKLGWLVIEINQKAANKGTALEYMAAYYNIPMTNTIALGDGLNDREMLNIAAHGVVMKNAKGTIKTYGNDITDYTNDDAGVGKYLEEFFNIK